MNAPRYHRLLIDPRRALGRVAISIVIGVAAGVALSLRLSAPVAVLAGWNAGGIALVTFAWVVIGPSDAEVTKHRASRDDPGRTATYVLVLFTSIASVLAATVLVRGGYGEQPHEMLALAALCLSTVALSWTLTHTAFALRYAHLYYREDGDGTGGVEFPGTPDPRYSDFAYLAFTVGMCFQVSDTAVTGAQIRRAVLLHAALSFFYNTAILAFVLNLIFGRAA